MTTRRTPRRWAGAMMALAMVTAACAQADDDVAALEQADAHEDDVAEPEATDDDTADEPPTGEDTDEAHDEASDESHDESVEHDRVQHRLVIADAASPDVLVVDLATGELVGELDLGARVHGHGAALTESGRYLLAPHDEGVSIVDVGTWSERHGDHSHHYTTQPTLLGHIDGPDPSHLVSHSGVSALFFDGDGSTTVVDESELGHGHLEVTTTIETGEPHHGFTVPVDEAGYVVTVPTDDMEGMPNVVGAADLSGEVTTRFDCTNTHGETSLPAGAAVACQDGVLLVTHDQGWDAALVPYPDVDDEDPYGYGNARAWVLFAPSGTDHLLAPLGARHVLLVDPRTAEARALELDADVALFGVAADRDGRLVVLATDGVVRVVDPADGTVLGAVAATGGFTEGDPEQPYRRLVVADDHAYVSDPDAGAIVEVALDEPAVTRTIDVGVAPGYLGVAGD